MSEQNIIQLEQTPVIVHKLKEVGQKVTERLNGLNLANQIATTETIATLKSTRAELNREAKEFEEQRKFIKDAVLSPYNEFESVYKTEIIEKYKNADNLLKTSISDFELKLKHEKRDNLLVYFKELQDIEQLDWLSFDRLGIEVNLSTSEKKYKEQILTEVQKIVSDLDLIATDTYSSEILVEYKKTLSASKAITEIRQRKEAEKQEAQRLKDDRSRKRRTQLRSLSFVFHDLTNTHNWINDESVMVSLADIENLSDEEWSKKHDEIEKIVLQSRPQAESSTPLSAPIVETKQEQPKEEIFEAKFSIQGTYKELMKLKEFLQSNNYNYKNIK